MTADVSLSIEETNKLRVSLGLKPLEITPQPATSSLDPSEPTPESRFLESRDKLSRDAEAAQLRDRIERTRLKSQLRRNVKRVKTIAEQVDDDEAEDVASGSARDWLLRMRQKELAVARERQVAEARQLNAANAMVQTYSERDLEGLKVAHNIDDIEHGTEVILHLADRSVLDTGHDPDMASDDQDELISADIVAQDKLKKNIENRKSIKRRGHKGYEDAEASTSILPEYDEEDDEKGFRIGNAAAKPGSARVDAAAADKALQEHVLEYSKSRQISDYYTQEETALMFRKSNSKKKRQLRQRQVDTSAVESSRMTETVIPRSVHTADHVNFVDDDDLQQALSRARQVAFKSKKYSGDAEIVARLAELADAAVADADADDTVSVGLVVSDTTEFVHSLQLSTSAIAPAIKHEPVVDADVDEPADMDTDEIKQEPYSADRPPSQSGARPETLTASLVEEPLVSRGVGAALSLLRQKGLMETMDADKIEAERNLRTNTEFIAKKRLAEAQKERKRKLQQENERQLRREQQELEQQQAKGKRKRGGGGGGGGNVLPEHLGGPDRAGDMHMTDARNGPSASDIRRERDHQQQEYDAMMREYRPDIQLRYHDEKGREVDIKEAYKILSHKFHGKEPGKNKRDKYEAKKEDALRAELIASGGDAVHTPRNGGAATSGTEGVLPGVSGLASVVVEQQQRTGQAHLLLGASLKRQ